MLGVGAPTDPAAVAAEVAPADVVHQDLPWCPSPNPARRAAASATWSSWTNWGSRA